MIREKSHSSKRLLLEEIDRAELELVRCYRKTLAHVNENENEMYDWDLNDLDFTAPFQLARGIAALEICREMAHGKTFSELTERNGKVIEALLCGVASPQPCCESMKKDGSETVLGDFPELVKRNKKKVDEILAGVCCRML